MRFRAFALALALLLAANPVLGVVCVMDCGRPVAAAAPCHTADIAGDGATLRGAPHACGHDHGNAGPAVLSGASARGFVGTSLGPASALALTVLSQVHAAPAALSHGPPGLSARTTSSRITVLRI